MKIKSIYIENIQSIHKIKIDLDDNITRLQGRNTCGKSAIAKSLALFSGTYTRNQIKALLRKDKPLNKPANISLLLENSNILTAVIDNKGNVDYIYQTQDGKVIDKWNRFNEEILSILKWTSVEDENLCLNVKDASTHLFINTKPQLNGVLVDFLCRNKDMELKIANLEEKSVEIKELKNDTLLEMQEISKKFRSYPKIDRTSMNLIVSKLINNKQKLLIFNTLSEMLKVSEYTKLNNKLASISRKINEITCINLILKKISIISQINELKKIKNNIILNEIDKNIHLKKKIIDNNEKLNKISKKINRLYNINNISDYNKSNYQLNNYKNSNIQLYKARKLLIFENNINKIENINKLDLEINKIDNKSYIKVKNKINTLNAIRYIDELIQNDNKLIKYYKIKSNMSKISKIKRLDDEIRNKYQINQENITLNKLNTLLKVLNYSEQSINIINDIENNNNLLNVLKNKLKENNICPLCGQPIDVEKYNGHKEVGNTCTT